MKVFPLKDSLNFNNDVHVVKVDTMKMIENGQNEIETLNFIFSKSDTAKITFKKKIDYFEQNSNYLNNLKEKYESGLLQWFRNNIVINETTRKYHDGVSNNEYIVLECEIALKNKYETERDFLKSSCKELSEKLEFSLEMNKKLERKNSYLEDQILEYYEVLDRNIKNKIIELSIFKIIKMKLFKKKNT